METFLFTTRRLCCHQTPGSIILLRASNAYLYSTLTPNASISNRNRDVNLFLVMPYWPPSSLPSSIIFGDCFLVIDDTDAEAGAAAAQTAGGSGGFWTWSRMG